jgi:predicted nucleic acid-binding protein
MKHYLLDTSALLTLRDDEQGAEEVAQILMQAEAEKVKVFGCFITLMEVLYRVWKDENETAGKLAYTQCKSLPVVWLHENIELLEQAAKIKANYSVSLADAWIAACAVLQDAWLVHKDPEFVALDFIRQKPLPYK